MMMNPLWKQFNLAEANLDKGGGILYALRYSPSQIQYKRECVVDVLKGIGLTVMDVGFGIGIIPTRSLSESEGRVSMVLLEELSVLNEATEHQDGDLGKYRSLRTLSDGLKINYLMLLEERNLVDAYEFVTMGIPQLTWDLGIAAAQGKQFSAKEKRTIEDLVAFSKSKERQLNQGRIVMIGSTLSR